MIFKQLKIIVFLSLFFNSVLFGQKLLPVFYDTVYNKQQLSITGNVFIHSSSIYNELANKLIFGKEISEELAQKTHNRQKNDNRLGGDYRLEIEYRNANTVFKSKPNWSWMVQISHNAHFYGTYSNDLFGLAFIGNENYLNDKVNIENTSARFNQFMTIGGGLHNLKSKSYLTLNAVFPQNFFQLETYKGNIEFSEIGDRADVLLEAEATTVKSYPYFKGIGAALNFDFNFPFGKPESFNGIIQISGRNIGFVNIFDADVRKIDFNGSYTGFTIDELNSSESADNLLDTLNIQHDTKSKLKLLPGFLQIGKIVTASPTKKIQSFFGIRLYANRIYTPLIYAGLHYQPINKFSIGSQLAYGGYGMFRLGMYINYNSEKWIVGAGTEDLLGAALKNQFGNSILIRLLWKF